MNARIPTPAVPLVLSRARRGRGDPEAGAGSDSFESLFAAEWERVMRVAWRTLGDGPAAEDVAQEVFLAFHQRYPKGMAGARGWLHVAAAHLALNRLRGERRRVRRERREEEPVPQADPEAAALASETRREINSALARLPRRQAALLALRYSGLSYAEVAEAVGVGVNQIGSRLRRAEAALLKEMGNVEIHTSS